MDLGTTALVFKMCSEEPVVLALPCVVSKCRKGRNFIWVIAGIGSTDTRRELCSIGSELVGHICRENLDLFIWLQV